MKIEKFTKSDLQDYLLADNHLFYQFSARNHGNLLHKTYEEMASFLMNYCALENDWDNFSEENYKKELKLHGWAFYRRGNKIEMHELEYNEIELN